MYSCKRFTSWYFQLQAGLGAKQPQEKFWFFDVLLSSKILSNFSFYCSKFARYTKKKEYLIGDVKSSEKKNTTFILEKKCYMCPSCLPCLFWYSILLDSLWQVRKVWHTWRKLRLYERRNSQISHSLRAKKQSSQL